MVNIRKIAKISSRHTTFVSTFIRRTTSATSYRGWNGVMFTGWTQKYPKVPGLCLLCLNTFHLSTFKVFRKRLLMIATKCEMDTCSIAAQSSSPQKIRLKNHWELKLNCFIFSGFFLNFSSGFVYHIKYLSIVTNKNMKIIQVNNDSKMLWYWLSTVLVFSFLEISPGCNIIP